MLKTTPAVCHTDRLLVKLSQFLTQRMPNAWLYQGPVEIYVRRGYHIINNTVEQSLDIANINVKTPGDGIGMRVIEKFHESHPFSITYIENVVNTKLYERLKRDGWIDVPNSFPPCVYKRKD